MLTRIGSTVANFFFYTNTMKCAPIEYDTWYDSTAICVCMYCVSRRPIYVFCTAQYICVVKKHMCACVCT